MSKLIAKLNQLNKDELVAFIARLQGVSAAIDQRIALLVTKPFVSDRMRLLQNRVQSLKGDQSFISYLDCGSFESELAELVTVIAELLQQRSDAEAVFMLVDGLMQSNVNVIERVEESFFVCDLYQQTAVLWLKAASQLRELEQIPKDAHTAYDWPQRVLAKLTENEYGVWDHLLENSALLLTVDELTQLALYFENTILAAQKNSTQGKSCNHVVDNFGTRHAALGLEGIAIALKDPELLEKSMLLRNPEPNEVQKNIWQKTAQHRLCRARHHLAARGMERACSL